MGFFTNRRRLQSFSYMISAFLLLLLLLLLRTPSSSALITSSLSSSSSTHDDILLHKTPSDVPAQYQVFYIKITTPSPLVKDKQEALNKKLQQHRRKMSTRHKNKRVRVHKKRKNIPMKSFSVMLPKGFVPPSGSSPCHNAYPNSVAFFCDLAPTAAKP